MTPAKAKKVLKAYLEEKGLFFTKLTARTVSFVDLARDRRIFVKVHGWKGNVAWTGVQQVARANGFCVEAD